MKKRSLALFLAFVGVTSASILSACAPDSSAHTHTYATEWTYDDTYHWHNAECAHMNENIDKAAHTFASGVITEATYDSAGYIAYSCTVCGYEKKLQTSAALEHTYSDTLTHENGDTHWYACTDAGYETLKKDESEHVYGDGVYTEPTFETCGYTTYVCDCGYEKIVEGEPALEHTYSDTLTHENGDTHWYACTDVGYETLKKDETKHTLTESAYDETTGYATYTCECGFTKEYLRSTILSLPKVTTAAYIGQPLSSLSLIGGEGSVDGTFTWSNPSEIVTESGNYNVTFTPTDDEYAPITETIAITAAQLTVTITVGENGGASLDGTVNVNYADSLTITFTPESGYAVGTLVVDDQEITAARTYTFENITENHTLSVSFVEKQEEELPFTLTCVSGTENAYTYENDVLTFTTISEETVYAISGEFEGSIVIDVGDTYKFDLELTGFTLTCSTINPITVLSGDEVSLTAKNGYENYIYDTREAIDTSDESLYSAAIYSLVDLEICGKGKLTVVSDNNNGIHTKDDLQVKNLTLSVTCVDNALKGNDGVEITNATTTLIATQGDCIKTTNSHISEQGNQKGTISIAGGTHNLYAACDGIDAAYNVLIEDSATVLNIYTDKYSEYSEEVTAVSESTYYLRYTSTEYKYSVKYYNSDTDYLWVNVSDDYETVTSSSSSGGGRPGQSSSTTTYYYYTFAKHTDYSKLAVYMYSGTQTQGQDTDYYACSEYKTINTNYDTVALTYKSNALSVSWTNYTTASTGGNMGGNMGGGMQEEGNTDKGDYSTKGIKAANEITINAGTVYIQAYDDAIHANNDGGTLENGVDPTGNVTINGGTVTVYSNDDGIHADGTLTVTAGTVNVTNAYEGLEGAFIIISGGNVSVVASDDGFNGTSTTGASIQIGGGTVYVYASGDGIDSNSTTSKGAILFSGGDVVVICTSSGNSAIDSDGGFTHTAGRVVAIMPTGGMTSESTNGDTTGMTTKSSLSLSSGGYLTVSADSVTEVTVQMPSSMTAYVVYLGSSSATIASASSSSVTLDSNGVNWYNE